MGYPNTHVRMDTGSPYGYFSEEREDSHLEVPRVLFLPLLPGAVPALCPMPLGLLPAGGDPHMAPESHPPHLLLHLLPSIPAGIIT